MTGLSHAMRTELDTRFTWCLCQVPELDAPTLIVFDYSPRDRTKPLSIAFDFAGGPKCWLTARNTRKIEDKRPRPHADYRQFRFRERSFYPYSVAAFPANIFGDIQELTQACARLYRHVDWAPEP